MQRPSLQTLDCDHQHFLLLAVRVSVILSLNCLKCFTYVILRCDAVSPADPIDIVTDPIPPHEYKAEEDTRLYKSAKTQRGPLRDDWIEEYNNNPGKTPIMCAYKLCKVEFRYWGMQSKIERFIHDVGKSEGFHY